MGLSIYGNLNPAFVRERDFRRRAWNITRLHVESLADSRNGVVAEYQRQFEKKVRALHPQLLADWRRLQELRRRRIEERKSAAQKAAFLDGNRLDAADDTGIEPHALATLIEYGIETALDVCEGNATTGLAPTLKAGLEAWAGRCEAGFRFDPALPPAGEDVARIDEELNPLRAALRKRITGGLSALAGLETEARMRIAHFEKQIVESIGALAQARADYALAYSTTA
jgi:DNA-binding helix-hairpin-helix protein with protein kinase domain